MSEYADIDVDEKGNLILLPDPPPVAGWAILDGITAKLCRTEAEADDLLLKDPRAKGYVSKLRVWIYADGKTWNPRFDGEDPPPLSGSGID